MTADQDERIANALTQIAYSLEHLTRYVSGLSLKFGIQEPPPPDPRDERGNPVRRR